MCSKGRPFTRGSSVFDNFFKASSDSVYFRVVPNNSNQQNLLGSLVPAISVINKISHKITENILIVEIETNTVMSNTEWIGQCPHYEI